MRRFAISFSISILLIFFASKNIYAVSIDIQNAPAQVSSEEFSLDVIVHGAKKATNYFRVLIFKEGTHTYLGETWNGNIWYAGADGKSYLPVTIESSATQAATIKARVGEKINNGDYLLSVKRYTQSGSAASDTVNEIKIVVNGFDPPQKETPPPTITASPKPSPASSVATKVEEEIETQDMSWVETTEPVAILAMETVIPNVFPPIESPLATPIEHKNKEKNYPVFPIVMLVAGAICVFLSGVFAWKQKLFVGIIRRCLPKLIR